MVRSVYETFSGRVDQRSQVGPQRETGPRSRRDIEEEEGEREQDLSEEKKRGPEARPTAGGFGQAHIGSFDSTRCGCGTAGPVREGKQQEER